MLRVGHGQPHIKVLKSPPVSGARNSKACCAPLGNRHHNAFLPHLPVPCFCLHEPLLGWWVRGAPEKGGHQQVVH